MTIEPVRISAQPSEIELFESWAEAFERLKKLDIQTPTLRNLGILLAANLLEEPSPDWQRDPMGLMPLFPSVQDYRCEVALLLRAIADWIDLG